MVAPGPDPNATTAATAVPPDTWLRSIAALVGAGSSRASVWIAEGTIVDDTYRVERPLAAGGMAVIYLARDVELDRLLALKIYDIDARELSLSRIYREARAMARLSHPNVLVVHGVGVHAQRVFLAMEYVEGNTLRGWLAETKPDPAQIVAMFAACGRGLAAAHAVGIVHGDFKPDNVLVGRDGRPRVADFGLARMIDAAREGEPRSESVPPPPPSFAGTLRYAAPEQHEGAIIDARADQFAFCVALFEALWSVHPFVGDDLAAIVASVRAGRLRTRPVGSAVPGRLYRVIARGLAIDPAQRFGSIEELVAALERDPWRRPRRIAAVSAIVGTVIALAWPRARACDPSDAAIEAVWSPERATRVGEAFAATRSPIGVEAHRAVVERLDRWADGWRAQRLDACAATHERGEQSDALFDRRMLCLDHELARASAAIDALEHADREVVAGAVDLIAKLPAPQRCAEVERLLAAVAPPEDEALAREVEDERTELARARTEIDLGRYPEAAAIAEAVRGRAPAEAYAPLAAEASLTVGIARWRAYENTAGETALTDAFHLAMAAGDDEVATVAARELVCNLAQLGASTERGAWWSRTAESLDDREHADEPERLELEACRGLLAYASGEYAHAESIYRAAIPRADALDDPDSLLPALLRDRFGAVLEIEARHEEARAEHRLAYDRALALRGRLHPLTLVSRSNLGQVIDNLGHPGEALAIHLDVLQSFILLYGGDSGRLPNEYAKVAGSLDHLGALQQALAYRARGIEIARTRGDQGRTLVVLLANQASDYEATGHPDRALELEAEAVRVSEAALGPTHPNTGKVRLNYGSQLAKAGRFDEAEEQLQRGLDILTATLGESHPAVGLVNTNLATLAKQRGLSEDMARYVDAADRIAEATDDDRLRAIVLFLRGDQARMRDDLAAARDAQQRAVGFARTTDPVLERGGVFQLGEDELALGDPAAALRSFARSLELSKQQGADSRVAESELAMARASWELGRKAEARSLAESARVGFESIPEPAGVQKCNAWLASHRAK